MRALASSLLFASLLFAGCDSNVHEAAGSSNGGGSDGGGGNANGGDGGAAPTTPFQARALALGDGHSCALRDDAQVVCWGDGSLGQLGDGHDGKGHVALAPEVAVPGLANVKAIAAGSDTTCALLTDGTVSCWGDGSYGELGDGTASQRHHATLPTKVVGLSHAVAIAMGTSMCALIDDGTVWCWGPNSASDLGFKSSECGPYHDGEVGDGGSGPTHFPCQATARAVPGIAGAVTLTVGTAHQCVTSASGAVTCWGENYDHASGDLTDAGDVGPTIVAGVQGSAVSAGASFSCALGLDQRVTCWGDTGLEGDLDDGTVPTLMAGVDHIVALSSASGTTIALKDDGTVFGWGDDVENLAKNTPDPSSSASGPFAVPKVADAKQVVTSSYHSCIGFADETWACWGGNEFGQLGNGHLSSDENDFTFRKVVTAP